MPENLHLAYREEFEDWMRQFKSYDDSTIVTRINNVERIEHAYGSLIDQWKIDRFESLMDQLRYSKTDELLQKRYTGPISINGSFYTNLAMYRSALGLYSAFLSSQKDEELGYPFGEIGRRVRCALQKLSECCRKKKKYTQKEVADLIITPLVGYMTEELSEFGYSFFTEKVATFNDEGKKTRDRYDVIGESDGNPLIIVEADTHRADQVSKKVISRLTLNSEREVLYTILVYPNDHKSKESEKKECKKYLRFINSFFSTMLSGSQKHVMIHWLFK